MGCASSHDASAHDNTSSQRDEQQQPLDGTIQDSSAPALRATPESFLQPHRGAGPVRSFTSNPQMDMTFSVLHDPQQSITGRGNAPAGSSTNPLRVQDMPTFAIMPSAGGNAQQQQHNGSTPQNRGGGSRSTPFVSAAIASPGVSRVSESGGAALLRTVMLNDGSFSQQDTQPSVGGPALAPSTRAPFTFENVKSYTEVENDKLRAMAKQGGPPVKGYPRTWIELMNMWVDDLPSSIPTAIVEQHDGDNGNVDAGGSVTTAQDFKPASGHSHSTEGCASVAVADTQENIDCGQPLLNAARELT